MDAPSRRRYLKWNDFSACGGSCLGLSGDTTPSTRLLINMRRQAPFGYLMGLSKASPSLALTLPTAVPTAAFSGTFHS